MSQNLASELWAGIEQNPEDVGAYAVLGDLLQESGDPHGELIALQCACEREEDLEKKWALQARADALLEQHCAALLGELAGINDYEVDLDWFCGHVRAATLWDVEAARLAQRLKALLQRPVGRALRELTVTLHPSRVRFNARDALIEPYGPLLQTLATMAEQLPTTLRTLALGIELDLVAGRIRVPDFAVALRPLQNLEALTITAGSANPGKGSLPQLRTLALHLSDIELRGWNPCTSPTLEELAAGDWPSLERLELWFGARDLCYVNTSYDEVDKYGYLDVSEMMEHEVERLDVSDYTGMSWQDLEPHLPGLVPPSVTWLGLGNLAFTDTLVAHLPQMPWWSRLRGIDLSHGTLSRAGAQTMVSQAQAWSHLEAIILDGNTLQSQDVAALRAALPQVRAEGQRSSRRPAFSSRYVSSVE